MQEFKHNRKIIYLAGFIFTIPIALTSYINSSFLETFMNDYYVSALYALASFLTIISFFVMPKILGMLGNRLMTLVLSSVIFFSLMALAFSKSINIVSPSFVLFFIASNLTIVSLDIFIEGFSKNKIGDSNSSVGRFRGLYLMVINAGWVVSQLISGSIIKKSSYGGIYLFAGIFMLVVAAIFMLFLHDFVDPIYKRVPIIKTLQFFRHQKNISRIYILDFALRFFFAWMIIYTPIYLHEYIMFDWKQIGFIFTVMLLPFVILSFPLGQWCDIIGEKKLLKVGYLIAGTTLLFIPMITSHQVWVWALVLFMTRVGAATIEVMTETYFFKSVNEENAAAISFFRSTSALSFIVAPLMALPILYFVPSFKYIFYVLSAIMLIAYIISLKLEDVK